MPSHLCRSVVPALDAYFDIINGIYSLPPHIYLPIMARNDFYSIEKYNAEGFGLHRPTTF